MRLEREAVKSFPYLSATGSVYLQLRLHSKQITVAESVFTGTKFEIL